MTRNSRCDLPPEVQFALLVLCWGASVGQLPDSLSEPKRDVWAAALMPHGRRLADLLDLLIRDVCRANPSLLRHFLRREQRDQVRALDDSTIAAFSDSIRKHRLADLDSVTLHSMGAEMLQVALPTVDTSKLEDRRFDRSALIAEMPGAAGLLSLHLLSRQQHLDPMLNMHIYSTSVNEAMLASWAVALSAGQIQAQATTVFMLEQQATTQPNTYDAALVCGCTDSIPARVKHSVTTNSWIVL